MIESIVSARYSPSNVSSISFINSSSEQIFKTLTNISVTEMEENTIVQVMKNTVEQIVGNIIVLNSALSRSQSKITVLPYLF